MKSVGLRARSVEMMTHRSVIGSLRSSGMIEKNHYTERSIGKASRKCSNAAPAPVIAIASKRTLAGSAPDLLHIILRRSAKRPHFFFIDIPLGRARIRESPGLYLDEYQAVALPRHDIDLTAPLRRPPVSRRDYEAALSQIAMSQVFSPHSCVTVFAVPEPVGEAVQEGQGVQTRTRSLCPAQRNKDKTPRTCGIAGTCSREIRSRAISRKIVRSNGRKSHEISLPCNTRSLRGLRRKSGMKSCSNDACAWDRRKKL